MFDYRDRLHFHPLQFLPDRFNFLVGLEGPFRLLDLSGPGGSGGIPGGFGGLEEPFRLLDLGVILNFGLDMGLGGISGGGPGDGKLPLDLPGGPGGLPGSLGSLGSPGGTDAPNGSKLPLDLPGDGFIPDAPNGSKLPLDLLVVLVCLGKFGKPKNPRDISFGLLLGSSLLVEIILDDSFLGGTKPDDGGSPDDRLVKGMGSATGDTFRDGYCLGTGSGIGSGNFDFNSSDPFSSFSTAVAAAAWISR